MDKINTFVSAFLDNYTLLGYFAFCLLATFIVISLATPRYDLSLSSLSHKSTHKRLNNIDFLKILLTYAIVLHHSLISPNKGYFSVELFFIISGFMLFYNYNPKTSTIDFIKKKLTYFFPYLFLGDILALCLFQNIDISNLFAGIFMYADTGVYKKFSVYAPSWYLVTSFWALVFYFCIIKNFSKGVCNIILGLIAFITWSAMENMGFILWKNEYLPLLTNGQVRAFSCIATGYFIALNYKPTKKAPTLFNTLLELGLLVWIALALFNQQFEIPINLIVILFIFLFLSFIQQKGYISTQLEKINWSPLAKYMLPIFMTHWVITMLRQSGRLWSSYSTPTQILLCFICATLFGIISYHVIHWGYYFQHIRDKKSKEKKLD